MLSLQHWDSPLAFVIQLVFHGSAGLLISGSGHCVGFGLSFVLADHLLVTGSCFAPSPCSEFQGGEC